MKQLSIKLISFLLLINVTFSFCQTKSYGNYEIYTYEDSRNGIGYLLTKINYPNYLNKYVFEQKGVLYTYQYFSNEIGAVNILNNLRVRFITEGSFNIGGGFSNSILTKSIDNTLYFNEFKLYSAKLDLYSFDIGTEATFVFPNAMAITAKFGLTLFSIGANAAFPEGGKLKDDIFGVVNLVPLILKPQLLIDFGRSILGIGFLIHPKNFIEYKYVPPSLFKSDERGIIFNDDFIQDYAIQLFFHY